MDNKENAVEFISGQNTCTLSLTNQKHINRIRRLHDIRPDDFLAYHVNEDGSIYAKIPLKWLRITPPRKNTREYSEEEKAALVQRLKEGKEKKKKE